MSEAVDTAVAVAVFAGGNAADLLTTESALDAGARERNPFGQTRDNRLALKLGSTLALTGADLVLQKIERRYVRVDDPWRQERRRPLISKLATVGKWTLRGVAAAWYTKVAINNARVERRLERAR